MTDPTVYVYNFEYYNTIDEEWCDVEYYTTDENDQYMTEQLIRDENNNIEDITLSKYTMSRDDFLSQYDASLLS